MPKLLQKLQNLLFKSGQNLQYSFQKHKIPENDQKLTFKIIKNK